MFSDSLDEPLIQVTSAGVLTFYHADKQGSIVGVSNASGASANKNQFSEFGEITTLGGTIFGFTGQRYDSETGLYFYKNRYYSPKIGRFLQPDPIGYTPIPDVDCICIDEDLSNKCTPRVLNLYTYVRNNPLKFTDPLGLQEKKPKKEPEKKRKDDAECAEGTCKKKFDPKKVPTYKNTPPPVTPMPTPVAPIPVEKPNYNQFSRWGFG